MEDIKIFQENDIIEEVITVAFYDLQGNLLFELPECTIQIKEEEI